MFGCLDCPAIPHSSLSTANYPATPGHGSSPGSLSLVTVPPGTVPPGSVPPGTVSSGKVPPGNVPPGTVPPGTVPPGGVTLGHVPPGTVPPGNVPPSGVLSKPVSAVCSDPFSTGGTALGMPPGAAVCSSPPRAGSAINKTDKPIQRQRPAVRETRRGALAVGRNLSRNSMLHHCFLQGDHDGLGLLFFLQVLSLPVPLRPPQVKLLRRHEEFSLAVDNGSWLVSGLIVHTPRQSPAV